MQCLDDVSVRFQYHSYRLMAARTQGLPVTRSDRGPSAAGQLTRRSGGEIVHSQSTT
jgi:hypothetical protein